MLPRLLCETLCSLNPNVDRFAFSVIWKLNQNAEIIDEWFGKTIIRSCSKLTYEIAQLAIEGKIKDEWTPELKQRANIIGPFNGFTVQEMVDDILALQHLATIRKKQRIEVNLSFK